MGFDEFLESTFCLLLVVEASSLQKVVQMLEEVVVSRQRGQVNMVDAAKLCSPILSTFEVFVKCDMQLRVVMEKN